tara:strand:- start:186 stop:1199 length:1014 start_codon:yes stop_codon:yes gene_type:complete
MAKKQYNINTAISMFNEKGKLFNLKKELSQQLRNEQAGIDVEEFPVTMQSEQNMNIFKQGKAMFKAMSAIEAKKEIESPEYAASITQMNSIKQGFEKIKNDLYFLADYKQKNWDNVHNVSKQESLEEVEFLHNLVVLPDSLDQSVNLSFNGSSIQGPRGENIRVSELPKLMPAEIGKSIGEPLNKLIQDQGVEQKKNSREFNSQLVRTEIKSLLGDLRNQSGIKGVKSAAYDLVVNTNNFNGTFMDNYFDKKDLNKDIEDWKIENPNENIENVKRAILPNMWNHENSSDMEKELEEFYVGLVYENYMQTKEVSPKNMSPTSNMSPEEKLNYYRNLSK